MDLDAFDTPFLRRFQHALILAAADMDQAEAAGRALQEGGESSWHFERALETAIAVCYARAFTQSSLFRLSRDTYEPEAPRLAEVHRLLFKLRDKVYAHTDKAGGRRGWLEVDGPVEIPGRIEFRRHEEWMPLQPRDLRDAVELFQLQRERLHRTAALIELHLRDTEGLGH